jgi:hypothetical protein
MASKNNEAANLILKREPRAAEQVRKYLLVDDVRAY